MWRNIHSTTSWRKFLKLHTLDISGNGTCSPDTWHTSVSWRGLDFKIPDFHTLRPGGWDHVVWRPRNVAITTHETGPVPRNPVILITPSPGPASLSHSRPPCTDSSSRTSRATSRYQQILNGNGLRISHKPRCAAKVRGGGLGQCQEAGQHRLAHLLHPPGMADGD